MLFKSIMKSLVYSKYVTINNIKYKKSKILKTTENYLLLTKQIITLSLLLFAYFSVKNGRLDFGYYNAFFIIVQTVVGFVIMIPIYLIFLPRPISSHLEAVVEE